MPREDFAWPPEGDQVASFEASMAAGIAPIAETFALHGQNVDHGAPVSFLVSASCGLGMTEGWAAPEQVLAQPLSFATDVFPLALMAAAALSAVIFGAKPLSSCSR